MSEPETTSSHTSERDIFLAALDHASPEERASFLDRACGPDSARRASVEALLASHKDDAFLETPVVDFHRTTEGLTGPTGGVQFEKPGDVIGRYKLLQQIGEGGVGTVFMADQETPVRRRVALKVIKPGMDTKSVIARFESERQALAMMDHPNIARVLDAGATATGRPYFVMELVRGVRVTEYCDQNQLSTRERLELFIKICHALQHAHLKGIIHRDVKPSNILVTLHDGVPVPKVIDFGIAKAIEQRLTEKTLFTEFQAFIGTPAYMSPEQAEMSGLDIDTRTDIYSLGVLLYEMLTSRTPFDAQELLSSGLDAMRRTIREREPMAPSTRLSTMLDAERTTIANRQQADPARLASVLKGDLDWIVLKALEKDRARRYDTANGLAMDVRRYLDNEPVLACPPSAMYRFQKLVKRNRLLFAAAGACSLALILGLALTTWQYLEKSNAYNRVLEAEHEQGQLRAAAERERAIAEAQALAARRKAYAADMNLAQQALAVNNLGRARELLAAQHPQGGQPDLRGWEWRYIWQQCQSDALFELCRMSNEVDCLTVSSDGRWVAIGEAGGSLSVWDLRARQQLVRIHNGPGRVKARFSPTSPVLAFTVMNERGPQRTAAGAVRLWDAGQQQYLTNLPISGMCRGIAFSSDGARLLVASDMARIWSLSDGRELATCPMPQTDMGGFEIAASPDLSLVACAARGGKLALLDMATGTERWNVTAADETVRALAFSPDAKILASGAGFVESAIRLWDVSHGTEIRRLEGHRTWVSSLVFWPDGETLASASADQTIRLWDLREVRPNSEWGGPPPRNPLAPQRRPFFRPDRPGLRPSATFRGHQLEVWSLALLPDNTTMVSGAKDGAVLVWDAANRRRDRARVELPEPVQAWRFAPDSKSILAVDQQGHLARWRGADFQDKEVLGELGVEQGRSTLISADATIIAAEHDFGSSKLWKLDADGKPHELPSEPIKGRPLAFVAKNRHLLTMGFRDQTIREWELEPVRAVRSWQAENQAGPFSQGMLSPDGALWLSTSPDGSASILELATGKTHRMSMDLKQAGASAFSPDGRFFATVSRMGIGALWETSSMRKVTALHGFLQAMNSVAFSPDGHRLAIGGDGNEAVKIWDVDSQQELLTLDARGSMFVTMDFSPDGTCVAAKNLQGSLYVWRTASWDEVAKTE